jgi:hypothetical protein
VHYLPEQASPPSELEPPELEPDEPELEPPHGEPSQERAEGQEANSMRLCIDAAALVSANIGQPMGHAEEKPFPRGHEWGPRDTEETTTQWMRAHRALRSSTTPAGLSSER